MLDKKGEGSFGIDFYNFVQFENAKTKWIFFVLHKNKKE
jgi:hypothetical protein